MATSSQQPPSRPLPEFGASPPNQAFFDMHNAPGYTAPNQNGNGNRVQHRLSTDFKNGGSAGYANGNGNGAMPVPNGMQHHIPDGGSRHRGTVSMGAFDGPRSPPNTKSSLQYIQRSQSNELTEITQILHMYLANSTDQDSAKQGKLARFLMRTIQPPMYPASTSPRYEDVYSYCNLIAHGRYLTTSSG